MYGLYEGKMSTGNVPLLSSTSSSSRKSASCSAAVVAGELDVVRFPLSVETKKIAVVL